MASAERDCSDVDDVDSSSSDKAWRDVDMEGTRVDEELLRDGVDEVGELDGRAIWEKDDNVRWTVDGWEVGRWDRDLAGSGGGAVDGGGGGGGDVVVGEGSMME